jgi:hypothetical protein
LEMEVSWTVCQRWAWTSIFLISASRVARNEPLAPGFIYFVYLFFIVVLGLHYDIYKSSYNISNVSYLNSPPPSFSFIFLPPIPGIVSTG